MVNIPRLRKEVLHCLGGRVRICKIKFTDVSFRHSIHFIMFVCENHFTPHLLYMWRLIHFTMFEFNILNKKEVFHLHIQSSIWTEILLTMNFNVFKIHANKHAHLNQLHCIHSNFMQTNTPIEINYIMFIPVSCK